jgi:hypothetical protein
MIAYQITINGKKVATAGLRQGVVSAIANWVFIPSEVAEDPDKDWHASFSLAGLDDLTSENVKWFRRGLKVGDEITLKLIETDLPADEPTERKPRNEPEV